MYPAINMKTWFLECCWEMFRWDPSVWDDDHFCLHLFLLSCSMLANSWWCPFGSLSGNKFFSSLSTMTCSSWRLNQMDVSFFFGMITKCSEKIFIRQYSRESQRVSVHRGLSEHIVKVFPVKRHVLFSNCQFTVDKTLQNQSSAIIFHMPNLHWENYSYPTYRWFDYKAKHSTLVHKNTFVNIVFLHSIHSPSCTIAQFLKAYLKYVD